MNADEHGLLTECVLGAIFEVSNTLGAGFLERVYQRALFKELRIRGLLVVTQAAFPVEYKGQNVGEYYADFLVEDVLLLELKCVERLALEHTAQCLNYLRASGRTLRMLVNFQRPKVEWKRVVHTPLVVKHDGEEVILIADCAGGRAQDQLVWAELEFDRNVRRNHGAMSGLEVGPDGSRADSLAVE